MSTSALSLPRRLVLVAVAALGLLVAGTASAEDPKATATANQLLADSGSYIPPKTAPQPTPTVGKPSAPAAPASAKPAPAKAGKAHAHGKGHAKAPHGKPHGKAHKPNPNARVKTKAPKRAHDKGSRKI